MLAIGFFPSGRAFGYIHYHPRDDGSVKYHEGWVLDGGKVLAAKAIETPWKSEYREHGEDVSLMLRTIQGDFHIQGTTRLPTFNPAVATPSGATFPPTQQAICLYRWDREEAFGMLERSSRLQRTDLVDKGSAVL